ncbi:MerR family transcriptional regulator [Lapidilactobacillus wuchangensis]|uniref:MerR family transcriptional regulator n=1 Tax=Lapidilactobacillus wuchangensis TaxID=2486001 RepID=UPI000F784452|nr:MerR family transcriptional regulator [Lapidilactobacillus wuchangensis]
MAYQTSELAKLAGVSQRTIRYYEQQGLLQARRDPQNNYRWFDQQQVDRLQQILFYRELAFPLATIKQIMLAPDFDIGTSLRQQEQKLRQQRARLDQLLVLLKQTQQAQEGKITMSDQAKFTAFKQQQVAQNDQLYGEELAAKYSDAQLQAAKNHWIGLSQDQVQQMQTLETDLVHQLQKLLVTTDLESVTAKQAFADHQQWLQLAWGPSTTYSAAAHRGLAAMYQVDPRFQTHYDQLAGAGATAILCQVIEKYAR